MTAEPVDPLTLLPSETILQILEFAPSAALVALTRVSKAWHEFINATHQHAIYSSDFRNPHPPGALESSFLANHSSFSRYFEDARNWAKAKSKTAQSTIQVGNDPVWRFTADFKRRFLLSTSHNDGFNVTDMETGVIIWRLLCDEVRPYAHLKYQDGTAVWDREDDSRGQGFVYGMTKNPPLLSTQIDISKGATGHLDQDQDIVMYSMGECGYHVYGKQSGTFLGNANITRCTNYWHIKNNAHAPDDIDHESQDSFSNDFPVTSTRKNGRRRQSRPNLARLPGRPTCPESLSRMTNGVLAWFLATSLWASRKAVECWFVLVGNSLLRDRGDLVSEVSILIECEFNVAGFDLGGRLSVKANRIMFEVDGRIYIVALDYKGRPSGSSYSISTASTDLEHAGVPVSFMALYDCIMSTYTLRHEALRIMSLWVWDSYQRG
ncbi:uncharacterized protein BCR38DRAFT_478749 [Pseudomassariella vexata]|uniref:F-box domain-containing protein n=1 Tax=Pseudomassariella vexata TaxID=1141098 RepID=A0A1Y2DAL9_9PEZI|nr:uncharacterized protein BCR38DRAFT_478749 [Pseudomassariella vexata]ORY56308.1 hypothetical protein BCR38DRAFT_478749 [Pseudomassariella vexata]